MNLLDIGPMETIGIIAATVIIIVGIVAVIVSRIIRRNTKPEPSPQSRTIRERKTDPLPDQSKPDADRTSSQPDEVDEARNAEVERINHSFSKPTYLDGQPPELVEKYQELSHGKVITMLADHLLLDQEVRDHEAIAFHLLRFGSLGRDNAEFWYGIKNENLRKRIYDLKKEGWKIENTKKAPTPALYQLKPGAPE